MQTVTQATEIIVYITGTERARANQIARALLNAGLLPKSSGRDLKQINAAQMLPLLAAIAMADKIVDAPRIANEFATLPIQLDSNEGGDEDEGEANCLPHFFALAMKKDGGWRNTSIEFARTAAGYVATINTTIEDSNFEAGIRLPFWRDRGWGGWAKTSFTISPEGVEIMRNLFARDDVEGMSFKLSTGRATAE